MFLLWSGAALIAALGLALITSIWALTQALRFDGPPNIIVASVFTVLVLAATVAGESALFTFWNMPS